MVVNPLSSYVEGGFHSPSRMPRKEHPTRVNLLHFFLFKSLSISSSSLERDSVSLISIWVLLLGEGDAWI